MTEQRRSPIDRAFLTNMEDTTELVLVRHGQQRWPDDPGSSTPKDWRDPPLTELGQKQAEATAAHLAGEGIGAVYSSGLARAHATAEAIAAVHDLEVTVAAELEEIHMFGSLPANQTAMDAVGPLLLAGVRERFTRIRKWDVYPHTETSVEFRRRISGGIEGILATHPAETIVVACHGGVINGYIADFLGLDEDMFFRPAHASIHRVLAKGDRRVILCLNEIRHLLGDEDLLTF